MAPCSTSYSSIHHITISDKDIKLRKPVAEKMRRDRINSCIEQLKIILEKEFHKQEPNSKLEKADILEMTVSFLRQQLRPGLGHSDYRQGYSHCWKDSLHFLPSGSSAEVPASPLQGPQPQGQQLQQDQRASSCLTLRHNMPQDSSSSNKNNKNSNNNNNNNKNNKNNNNNDSNSSSNSSSSSSSRGPVWRPW